MSYLPPATGHASPRAFPSSPRTLAWAGAWAGRAALTVYVIATALAAAAPVQARSARYEEWATITNKRFGFQIAYPSKILFPIETPSGTQDGRVLQSEDGKAKLLIATFENGEGLTLDAYRDFLLAGNYANTDIDYAPQKSRWFVLSGVKGDQTFYERVTFSCGGRLINSWAMLYPTAQKKLYDPILEAVSRTYTAGAGADGNCGEAQLETPEAGDEKPQR